MMRGEVSVRYKTFKNEIQLSKLGLGAMRLPQTEP